MHIRQRLELTQQQLKGKHIYYYFCTLIALIRKKELNYKKLNFDWQEHQQLSCSLYRKGLPEILTHANDFFLNKMHECIYKKKC